MLIKRLINSPISYISNKKPVDALISTGSLLSQINGQ